MQIHIAANIQLEQVLQPSQMIIKLHAEILENIHDCRLIHLLLSPEMEYDMHIERDWMFLSALWCKAKISWCLSWGRKVCCESWPPPSQRSKFTHRYTHRDELSELWDNLALLACYVQNTAPYNIKAFLSLLKHFLTLKNEDMEK